MTTGHADGVITLDLAESDDAHRVAMREQMGEPYRTVLGHLRHEIGHYYFPILTSDDAALARARELFGDERADYSAALERHYAEGPPPGWETDHVSAYADHAPVRGLGRDLRPLPPHPRRAADRGRVRRARRRAAGAGARRAGVGPRRRANWDFEAALADWLPLTYALNAINRSMGRSDVYPFVLSEPVTRKLAFVDERVRARAASG